MDLGPALYVVIESKGEIPFDPAQGRLRLAAY
jgi:hypothetical protein